jgi:hypothetical protein
MPVQDICPPELGFGRCLTTGKLEAGSRARDQESPLLLFVQNSFSHEG